MKKRVKKWMLGLIGTTLALSLAACGGTNQPSDNADQGDQDQQAGEQQVNVGVIQIEEHAALDAARKGFMDALAENGYKTDEQVKYNYQNAQGDINNATTIAQQLVGDKVDLILAIATPSAQSAAQATQEIPILITAVTDPVDAKLVASMDKPGANVTGTSDMNPIKEQLTLIKDIVPDAKTVGIIYNSGEDNSILQVNLAKEYAQELGFEIVERTISNSSEVKQAAESMPKVDAFYVPTDNKVVAAIESVLMVAEQAKVPVIAGESESVKNGALITYGLDYYELGKQTGEMAIRILKGEAEPAEMAIETQKNLGLTINKKAAERFGVTIPQKLLDEAVEIIE
ncbi:sugar ABC transporter substrate-binding protein [Ammoniphilus oxalaticus]|uniref:Sugar ABC transporter substrate-binding protein n=1 Tax=Ammoniphilus oxalaticus TaxID=66863 RepID=A0A419SRD3_9BACL|nr:ABC transporter substrate-binding protein [Ammoniphilus oxalaticus]RKD27059.1 sugar ABC transporter substrate-binding protein [Ammoniphilus oxalaticus]